MSRRYGITQTETSLECLCLGFQGGIPQLFRFQGSEAESSPLAPRGEDLQLSGAAERVCSPLPHLLTAQVTHDHCIIQSKPQRTRGMVCQLRHTSNMHLTRKPWISAGCCLTLSMLHPPPFIILGQHHLCAVQRHAQHLQAWL